MSLLRTIFRASFSRFVLAIVASLGRGLVALLGMAGSLQWRLLIVGLSSSDSQLCLDLCIIIIIFVCKLLFYFVYLFLFFFFLLSFFSLRFLPCSAFVASLGRAWWGSWGAAGFLHWRLLLLAFLPQTHNYALVIVYVWVLNKVACFFLEDMHLILWFQLPG